MRSSLARTPPGDVLVRAARSADAARLAELHRAAIDLGCRGHYDAAQVEAWLAGISAPLHRAAIREQCVIVAERHRRAVAFGEYQPRTGQVVHLFTDPALAGCGLGSRVLAALEARAREDGRQEVRLRASLNAARFYERHGYVAAGGPRSVRIRGVDVPCLPMRKPLPSEAGSGTGDAPGTPGVRGAASSAAVPAARGSAAADPAPPPAVPAALGAPPAPPAPRG